MLRLTFTRGVGAETCKLCVQSLGCLAVGELEPSCTASLSRGGGGWSRSGSRSRAGSCGSRFHSHGDCDGRYSIACPSVALILRAILRDIPRSVFSSRRLLRRVVFSRWIRRWSARPWTLDLIDELRTIGDGPIRVGGARAEGLKRGVEAEGDGPCCPEGYASREVLLVGTLELALEEAIKLGVLGSLLTIRRRDRVGLEVRFG